MIGWGIEALVTSTLLMLLVLGVRKPLAQLFGAEWAYALWLLPLAVPLLPPLPLFAPAAVPEIPVILPALEQIAVEAPQHAASGGWLLVLLGLWAGGAAIFAFWQQSTYSAFMLHLGRGGRDADPVSYGGIRVAVSDAVEGPVAVGIFRRRIVVPLDFMTRYTPAERRLALEHELIHHKRLDLVWNWAALALLTLNWFNPVAHIAFRAFRADQELACDAAVTRRASAADRHDYACALVKAATQSGLIAVCALNHTAFLKRRLRMMKQHRSSKARNLGGAASLALLGGAGLALAAPGLDAEERPAGPVVAAAVGPGALIAPADLSKLQEKCGSGTGALVCTREEAEDPEVRAIVEKTLKNVRARTQSAMAPPVVDAPVAPAPAAASQGEVGSETAQLQPPSLPEGLRALLGTVVAGQHAKELQDAIARARASADGRQADVLAALESGIAAGSVRVVKAQITAEQLAQLRLSSGAAGGKIGILRIDRPATAVPPVAVLEMIAPAD